MKKNAILLVLIILFGLKGRTWAEEKTALANAEIIDNQGQKIGSVVLRQGTRGLLINIKVRGLTPGYHGMHFHKSADCSEHAKFSSAQGHVDPHGRPHGYLHPQGPHEGNLPNLIVSANGEAEVELYSEMLSLGTPPVSSEWVANLLDEDGSSLIVHAKPDDHLSQPIGNSGDRVACASLRQGAS